MSRPKLVKAIDRYLQRYPEEQAVGQEFKQFVLAHEDCFARSLQIGHVTARHGLLIVRKALFAYPS